MYFNYHAKIKKLIDAGQLDGWQYFNDYKGIKPAIVLYFKNVPPMPIRQHKFEMYYSILKHYKEQNYS